MHAEVLHHDGMQADIPKEGVSRPGAPNPGAIGPAELLDVKVPAPKREGHR